MRVKATAEGYCGLKVRKKGEVFDFHGVLPPAGCKKKPWFVPTNKQTAEEIEAEKSPEEIAAEKDDESVPDVVPPAAKAVARAKNKTKAK